MLAEATTTEISKEKKPVGFENNRKIAKQGGTIAGNTRKAIEAKSGRKIVTRQNAKQLAESKNKEIEEGTDFKDEMLNPVPNASAKS